jgi:hypothetical protein
MRQYRRPLASHGVEMTETDAVNLMKTLIDGELDAAARGRIDSIAAGLLALVEDSIGVLAASNLTFAQSLDTPMEALSNWETTGEFLALAEAKSNAELRIALGAILLYALGNETHIDIVRLLAARADDPALADMDTITARRLLERASDGGQRVV